MLRDAEKPTVYGMQKVMVTQSREKAKGKKKGRQNLKARQKKS